MNNEYYQINLGITMNVEYTMLIGEYPKWGWVLMIVLTEWGWVFFTLGFYFLYVWKSERMNCNKALLFILDV